MYENLTYYIPMLEKSDYGKWVKNDQYPFVLYNWEVKRLIDSIHHYADDHKGIRGINYCRILEEKNITWNMRSMKAADVSSLDGRTVFALLYGAVDAEKYSDGALLEFCESGCVLRWLKRLKEIDLAVSYGLAG